MLEKSLPPRQKHKQSQPAHSTAGSKSASGSERRQQQQPTASPCSSVPQFPTHSSASGPMSISNNPGNGGNVDQVLFENLVEVVPLIETLMGQRANSSFSRRASVIYTPAPSRANKNVESKGSENSSKKKRDRGVSFISKDAAKDCKDTNDSIFPSKPVVVECRQKNDEVNVLKEELDELQKKIAEKDGILRSVENSVNDLKHQVQQKDTLIRSTHSQLNDAKINLADKQAKLEKLQWEAKEANNLAMKLQEKLDSVEFEVCAFMQLYQEISKTASVSSFDENTTYLHDFKQLPDIELDETATEDAQRAYLETLAAMKMNPSEESVSNAAEARMRLQALVL